MGKLLNLKLCNLKKEYMKLWVNLNGFKDKNVE